MIESFQAAVPCCPEPQHWSQCFCRTCLDPHAGHVSLLIAAGSFGCPWHGCECQTRHMWSQWQWPPIPDLQSGELGSSCQEKPGLNHRWSHSDLAAVTLPASVLGLAAWDRLGPVWQAQHCLLSCFLLFPPMARTSWLFVDQDLSSLDVVRVLWQVLDYHLGGLLVWRRTSSPMYRPLISFKLI